MKWHAGLDGVPFCRITASPNPTYTSNGTMFPVGRISPQGVIRQNAPTPTNRTIHPVGRISPKGVIRQNAPTPTNRTIHPVGRISPKGVIRQNAPTPTKRTIHPVGRISPKGVIRHLRHKAIYPFPGNTTSTDFPCSAAIASTAALKPARARRSPCTTRTCLGQWRMRRIKFNKS